MPAVFGTSTVPTILNSPFIGSLLGIIGLSLAAFIAAKTGLRNYGRQKVQENIEKRYLEGGLENLISYLNNIRRTLEDEYTATAERIRHLREMDIISYKEWLKNNDCRGVIFSPAMPDCFMITSEFITSEDFVVICSSNFVGATTLSEFLVENFPRAMESDVVKHSDIFAILDPKNMGERWEVTDEMKRTLDLKWNKFNATGQIYGLIAVLEEILLRLRELKITSYKKFTRATTGDRKVKQYLGEIKTLRTKRVTGLLDVLEKYLSAFENKNSPQVKEYRDRIQKAKEKNKHILSGSSTDEELESIYSEINSIAIEMERGFFKEAISNEF